MLLYADIDDPAQIFAFINHFHKLALQCYRKLVNDRRIDKSTFCRGESGFLHFLRLFFTGYQTYIIAGQHVFHISGTDRECPVRHDVVRCFVM